jgi:predicted RecB family endonuclease
MLFSISIARNMFRVCSVNRAAREAVLSAAEAIAREIGREVIIILREVIIIVIESKSNRTTSGDLLEPFKSSSGDAKIKRLKLHNNCGVFC